jgi:hypothetical protein
MLGAYRLRGSSVLARGGSKHDVSSEELIPYSVVQYLET